MSTEPLPTALDVRKAAARGAKVTGALKPLDLARFMPLVADAAGIIRVKMVFSQDEERRYLVHLVMEADIVVTCQRCLGALPTHLASNSTLAIVWTDEEAIHLPKEFDPLIVEEPICNLWHIVEDELILSLPAYNYHKPEDCKLQTEQFRDPGQPVIVEVEKQNPFDVLEKLRPGK